MDLTFNFTKEEATIIINSLAKEAYGSVYTLIAKFQEQANSQMGAIPEPEEVKAAEVKK